MLGSSKTLHSSLPFRRPHHFTGCSMSALLLPALQRASASLTSGGLLLALSPQSTGREAVLAWHLTASALRLKCWAQAAMKQRHLAHATVLGAGQAPPGCRPPAHCWLACPASLPLRPAVVRSKAQLRLPAGTAPDLAQQGPAWHHCPESIAASCLWPCGS